MVVVEKSLYHGIAPPIYLRVAMQYLFDHGIFETGSLFSNFSVWQLANHERPREKE
jgi:hypothetical protein